MCLNAFICFNSRYHMGEAEAVALTDFLLPMLSPDPLKRRSAKQMLSHPWLRLKTPQDEIQYCHMVINMQCNAHAHFIFHFDEK